MTTSRTLKTASAVVLALLSMHGCGGEVTGDQDVIAAGGADGGGSTPDAGGASGCSACDPVLEQCFGNQYCVAKLVPLVDGYSIDATEVTRDQYASWLVTNPSTAGQAAVCSWNTDFTPDTAAPDDGCDGSSWPPGSKGSHPAGCVDWCDAYAYCNAVGKRLCGKIGGGANLFADDGDASKSQWFNACSSGGTRNYPYGGDPWVSLSDGYAGQLCNGIDKGMGTTMPVGSCPGCTSTENGYTGVFDLSGNVWEWEDSCQSSTGESDFCRIRGGSFLAPIYSALCANDTDYFKRGSGIFVSIGFRCCSNP